MKASSSSAPEFRIGEKVPGTNWVVRNLLGRGGMGVVLEVEKASGLRMAMKVVPPGFAQSEAFTARFLEEVRLLARLRHPNIVEVTDCDTLADGSPYIMMERLQGRTLREALSDKEIVFTAENVWNVLGQLCGALHCAHTAQPPIVHRDVKPANVFLYDRKHFVASVKLIDFGISAALDEKRASGAPMGTARYMAPEACRGDPPSPQVDLYALGIIAYEMLTRAWPWDLESRSVEAMMDAHLNLEPVPPSHRVGWIPKSVDECVLRALGKDPARRQQDVLEFRDQLGELPFVDDGSGNHRSEGITAPTVETLAHGRGGPQERAATSCLAGPPTSSPASVYVSAEFEETSKDRRAPEPSSGAGPGGSGSDSVVPELKAGSTPEREESADTPLSSASEPRVRRRHPASRVAAMVLGSLLVAASAVGYRAARGHATVRAPAPAQTRPASRVDVPVVERPVDPTAENPTTPIVPEASRDAQGSGSVEATAGKVAAKPSSLREAPGPSRSAAPKRSGARAPDPRSSIELEPKVMASKAKRPLSDEELLFIPAVKP